VNKKEGRGGKENEEGKDKEAAQICGDSDDSGAANGIPLGDASGCFYGRVLQYIII